MFCLCVKMTLILEHFTRNLQVNLTIEILNQYKYVAQLERLNYGTLTTRLTNGSAYRCKIM